MAGVRYSTREAPSIFHIVCLLSMVLLVSQFFLEKERESAQTREKQAQTEVLLSVSLFSPSRSEKVPSPS